MLFHRQERSVSSKMLSYIFIPCTVLTVFKFVTVTGFSEFSFVTEPVDTVVTRNQPAILHCAVHYQLTGPGPVMDAAVGAHRQSLVSVVWLKDSLPVTVGATSQRQLLANGSLWMDNSAAEEGAYQCRVNVTGIGILLSRKAYIRMANINRTFTAEPNTTTSAYLGDIAMFACIIGGLPRPQIQWIKDDMEIVGALSNYVFHDGGSILEIRNVQFTDFGRYRCKATNVDRSKTSSLAVLAQNSDASTYQGVVPRFIMQPTDQVVAEGATAVFYCAANGRDRNGNRPRITWLKDGITIDVVNQDGRFSMVGESSLRIDGVLEEDVATYTCRAANLEDSVDAHAALRVLVAPKLRQRPRNSVGLVSTDKELVCDVYSKPESVIQWMKDGQPVQTDSYVSVISSRTLRILGLTPADAGMYQCFASAGDAGSLHASAQLVVLSHVIPANAVGVPSSPNELTTPIVSVNFLMLSWQPPDYPGSSDIFAYSVWWQEHGSSRHRELNVTSPEANIQHLKPSTMYTFRVYAVNSHGYSLDPAQVTVETQAEAAVPDVPANLQAIATSPTSILVTWEAPSRGSTVISYSVYYYDIGMAAPTEVEVNVTEGTSCLLTSLKKFHQYSVRVVGVNSNGVGVSTSEVLCRTHSDVPSAQPVNPSVEALSSTSVIVHWEPPAEDSMNGIITGYKIRYRISKERQFMTATADGGQTRHSLTDLARGTEYSISVRAMTVNGTGPLTPQITVETLSNDLDESVVPGEPTSLRVRPQTTSIIVSWTPPASVDSVMIRGYILGYGIGVPDVYRQILDSKQRYHTIKGLLPSSEYVISLKAFNNAGHGKPRLEQTITREETTPEPQTPIMPPVGLKATVLSATTILLTWTDTTLGRSQRVTDNRVYTVRYQPRGGSSAGPPSARKQKMINSTILNIHIEELKPDTEYEFSVRIVKGRRQSPWSLNVLNKTKEMVPSSSVRDLTPVAVEGRPTWVSLNWQPPKQTNGQITGYKVFYTTDATQRDRDWVVEEVKGDRLSTTIRDLSPETTYYFKIQARNSVDFGPSSPTVIFRTPRADGTGGGQIEMPDDYGRTIQKSPGKDGHDGTQYGSTSPLSGMVSNTVLWIIIGVVGGITFIVIIIVVAVLCRRHLSRQQSRQHGRYQPANKPKPISTTELQPPDLWINYDRARQANSDRSEDPDEETAMMTHVSSSDVDSGDVANIDRYRRMRHCPKPVMIPVDQPPLPRDATSQIVYPRSSQPPNAPPPQYPGVPRVNAGDLVTSNRLNNIDDSGTAAHPPVVSPTSKPVLNTPDLFLHTDLRHVDRNDESNDDTVSSPTEQTTLTSIPKTLSTEELSAEMANLDGLMKDLSAITQMQQEFDL